MTLSTTASRVSYPGAGSVGPFAYPFRIFAASDLNVIKRSATGVETAFSYITNYTVSGVGNATGTVTLTTALAVGETLVIRRIRPVTQQTSVRNLGPYFAGTHEDAFDHFTMVDQQQQDQLDRSFKIAPTLEPSGYDMLIRDLTAGKVMTGTGTGLTMSTLVSSVDTALPGEGRTVQTLSAYLINNKVYNVLDYAPIGVTVNNGVGDATSADDAAIAAAAAAGGGIVWTPPGRYKRTSARTVSTNGLMLLGAGRGIATYVYSGATDGVILSDGISLSRIVLQDFSLETTNAGGLKAIKADFHTSGGTEHVIRNISITQSGAGRWAHGFWGNNFQTSALENVRVVQSATVSFHFENFCNATHCFNCEGTGSSGAGTIERGIEVDGTTDLFFHGGTFQGYYTKSLIYITGSGVHFDKTHLENTNFGPTDGADVVVGNTASACVNGSFVQMQAGTFIIGVVGMGSIRNYWISFTEANAVTFGPVALGCGITYTRAPSITDNNTAQGNTVFGCSNSVGTPFANKFPAQNVKQNFTAIPTAGAAPNSAFILANAANLSALDSTGALKDLLFISGADQTFFQFLTVLNIRDTAGVQYAQLTSSVLRLIAGLNLQIESSNGAIWRLGQSSELLVLSTVGTTTDTVGNLLPANSIIEAVVARVTTAITVATDWKLGDGTTAGRFAAANAVMTLGSTSIGLVHQQGGIASDAAGPGQTAAAKVRVTTTGTPGAGAIRITVFYRQLVAPTS